MYFIISKGVNKHWINHELLQIKLRLKARARDSLCEVRPNINQITIKAGSNDIFVCDNRFVMNFELFLYPLGPILLTILFKTPQTFFMFDLCFISNSSW